MIADIWLGSFLDIECIKFDIINIIIENHQLNAYSTIYVDPQRSQPA